MSWRPARVDIHAMRVVKACPAVSAGAFKVWFEDYVLDRGPQGSYVSASRLGMRVGMAKSTVEEHRRDLRSLSLYWVLELKGLRIKGEGAGWCPFVPPMFIPPGGPRETLPDELVYGKALALAGYIEGVRDGSVVAVRIDAIEGGPGWGNVGTVSPANDGRVRAAIDGLSRRFGGSGGSSSSSSHPQKGHMSRPPQQLEDEKDDARNRARRKDEEDDAREVSA